MLPFFHRMIVELNKGLGDVYNDDFFQKQSRSRYKYIIHLLKKFRMMRLHKCDLLIISSTLHNIESKGRKYNNLIEGYEEIYGNKVMVIEDSDSDGLWRERADYSHVSYINTYLLCLTRFLSALLNKVKVRENDDYRAFVDAYPTYFSKPMLSRNDYFVTVYSFLIKRLLDFVNPKVLLLEDASYGTEHAVICKIAKDRGLKVVELQHGMTYGCSAYQTLVSVNYDKEYDEYLPNSIFTFGDYWNHGIQWEYEKYPVGNAYLNHYRNETKSVIPTYDYLILSQPFKGVEPFIKAFSEKLKVGKILLRLHPSEDFKKNEQLYRDCDNIILSQGTSLYDDIVNSVVIAGWASTCVYEILAFGKEPVIIDSALSREGIPSDIGVWIKTPEQLLALNGMTSALSPQETAKYWEDSFETKVKSYFSNILN